MLAGGTQNPVANRNNQSGLFGDVDKISGRDDTAVRMVPAQQSLGSDQKSLDEQAPPSRDIGRRLLDERHGPDAQPPLTYPDAGDPM